MCCDVDLFYIQHYSTKVEGCWWKRSNAELFGCFRPSILKCFTFSGFWIWYLTSTVSLVLAARFHPLAAFDNLHTTIWTHLARNCRRGHNVNLWDSRVIYIFPAMTLVFYSLAMRQIRTGIANTALYESKHPKLSTIRHSHLFLSHPSTFGAAARFIPFFCCSFCLFFFLLANCLCWDPKHDRYSSPVNLHKYGILWSPRGNLTEYTTLITIICWRYG